MVQNQRNEIKTKKKLINKLVKIFRGASRNSTTFADAYNIPPVYM